MADYLIHPWDSEDMPSGSNPEIYVPPEIDELAQNVISNYDMEVRNKTLITSKPDKGGVIWKLETDQGPRSLKVLHRKPQRSLFCIGAQDYIAKQGGRVPEFKKTKQGLLYVEKGGKLWIVTDWIEPLTPAGKDLQGACDLCYGLGEFHRHSRGYIPPAGSQKASRLYHWPAYYREIIAKFGWFRNIAKAYDHIPASHTLLSVIDIFEQQALDALSLLEQSSYVQMVSLGEEHWGLAHQDFGWSNGQLGPGGLWVIDLDGVAYDLPVRDLRKLISSTMDDMGRWDITWILGMIEAYHQANPLDQETYWILLNDLAFPNEFYKSINEMLFAPPDFLNNNLTGIMEHLNILESTKGLTLNKLKRARQKYPAGNYASGAGEPETLEMMQVKASIKDTASQHFQNNSTEVKDNKKELSFNKHKKNSLQQTANKKLKVLMICTEKLPVPPIRGGAIQTYIQGISGILGQAHELTILGTSDPSLPQEEYKDNIRYIRIDGGQILEIYALGIISFLQTESFDLIHIFNRPRLISLVRQAAPQARLILSMHNDMFDLDKIHPNDAVTAINEVERIITISDYVGKKICSLYPQAASKVQTVYSGVNLNVFSPWEKSVQAAQVRQKLREEYKLESKTVLLFVGRLTPKKGIDLLIHALNELQSFYADIALVIVGGTWYSDNKVTDYASYIRTLAERAPFPVITTGYVPGDLVHQWFWAGDIFVCPSQWQEPLARVHYEAMAAGLPFITTARGGNPEVVIRQNGLIVDQPENAKEFAEKVQFLLAHPKVRQIMGQNGRRLTEERFSWERVSQEVLETWNAIKQNIADHKVTNTEKRYSKKKTRKKLRESAKILNKLIETGESAKILDKLIETGESAKIFNKSIETGESFIKINRQNFVPVRANNSSINYDNPSVVKITSKMFN